MHIDRVHIERLLGFKRLELEVDARLQLVAGPNNAGKSSLIGVLETFFSDPTPDDIKRLKPLNDYYVDGGPRMLSSIKVHFGGMTPAEAEGLEDIIARDGPSGYRSPARGRERSATARTEAKRFAPARSTSGCSSRSTS